MRFTRHAKNAARRLGLEQAEIEAIVVDPRQVGQDSDGKPIYEAPIDGNWLRVVVALDDPDVIVTIYDRKQ